MKKVFTIALKDLLLNFRDPMGLVLMLVAPLALTLVIAAAFGGSNNNNGGISDIPVVIVNQDTGKFSPYIIEAFSSDELADLVEPIQINEVTEARKLVDDDQSAAAVIIPENFSESILPSSTNQETLSNQPMTSSIVEVYANPSRNISSGIIRSIVDQILLQFSAARIGSQVNITQLLNSGRIHPEEAFQVGMDTGEDLAKNQRPSRILLSTVIEEEYAQDEFNWLEYSAPSMAILFLMFTLTASGRSLLLERDQGTLPRMLTSPSSRAQILGGKMLGNYLTGLLQMSILLIAGHFLFNISWGNPVAVIVLTLALVAAITGWGMLPAAFSRTSSQAGAIGTAITLTFSALSGTFVPRGALPKWLQDISLLTPNAWGNEWYYNLINGATIQAILPAVLVLLMMAVVLFGAAVMLFRRQYR